VHNSQPWCWTYDGHRLNLYADWGRQLHHGDPDRRDLEISCGAALHHAVVAAAGKGYRANVQRMLDPNDATHLATITFRETERRPSAETLTRAIYWCRTDRRTPSSVPVPKRLVKELVDLGEERGAFVIPIHERDDRALVTDLRELAEVLQHDDEEYLAELDDWTHSRKDEGVPDPSVLAPSVQARSRPGADSRFSAGVLRDQPTTEDPSPTWIVVATSSDDSLSPWAGCPDARSTHAGRCSCRGDRRAPRFEGLPPPLRARHGHGPGADRRPEVLRGRIHRAPAATGRTRGALRRLGAPTRVAAGGADHGHRMDRVRRHPRPRSGPRAARRRPSPEASSPGRPPPVRWARRHGTGVFRSPRLSPAPSWQVPRLLSSSSWSRRWRNRTWPWAFCRR
jgi:hypothetical protein